MKKQIVILAMSFSMLVALENVFAKPALKENNPGLPGCLFQVNQLEQIIADQNSTILGLQEQIEDLQALLDATKTYARVPHTGKTEFRADGDDGDLQKGAVLPHPRFTDNGDGTITDNLTRLIWLEDAECLGQTTWANALVAANTLADGTCGLTDGSAAGHWRLPNVRELHSLVNFAYSSPAISNATGTAQGTDGDPFWNLGINTWYWTSTAGFGNIDGAACVDFIAGGIGAINLIDSTAYVTAVRGGN